MESRYEVEVIVTGAKDLKNVNWRHGILNPYAVLWLDPKSKYSTHVDQVGDTSPNWNQSLLISFTSAVEDSTLYIDIVHADADEDTKPIIGSAKIPLKDVVDEVGFGTLVDRKLDLKRPSGRPHGKLEVKVAVRDPRYRAPPEPYPQPMHGVPPPAYGSHDGAPSRYPIHMHQTRYGQPVYSTEYGQSGYYGQTEPGYVVEEKKSSKFGGMGTGLAVGAVAGALGGLAVAEGLDEFEDEVADDVADRVEESYDGDDF